MRFLLIVRPDLRRAAPFHDHHDFLVPMPFGIECTRGRHLDHVAAPFAFRAEQLDERPSATHPLPWRKRHILHAPYADAAKNRDALALHEIVISRVRPLPSAISSVLIPLR